MHLGLRIGRDVLQPFQSEDFGERLSRNDLGCRELASCLVAQRTAVNDEADATEPLRREQAVEERDGELGLASAGRHRDQHRPLVRRQSRFDRLDGIPLVGAERKSELERLGVQRSGRRVLVDLQQAREAVGRGPINESATMVRRPAGIPEPDAALGLDLLEIRAAVRGEDERHAMLRPRSACKGEIR